MRHPKRYTHNTAELVSAIVVVGIGIGIGVDIDILPRVHATTISTFSDSHCGAFLSTIEVADSTGSGPCRDITSRYGSFEIGSLGPDCAVTIYGRDPQDPYCSATNLLLAASNQCYNSTWISFSVDNCAPAESVASSPTTATATATATADTALPTGSADRNTATTASVSWPNSESAPRASSADGPNIGAIVGGSVGGLAVIGVLAIYFFGLRPIQKRQRKEEEEEEIPQELPEPPMSPDAGLAVSSARKEGEEEEEEEEVRYPVFELSQQNVVEVHGDTVDRHELA